MSPRSTPAARAVRTALVAATWGAPCFGKEPCGVEVVGPSAPEWQRAAERVEDVLGDDCARLEVAADGRRARLIFVTADGRRAERDLGDPDELTPSVQALQVTLPVPLEPAPEPPRRQPSGTQKLSDGTPTQASRRVDAPSPRRQRGVQGAHSERLEQPESRAIFALQGGTRVGSGHLLSPVIAGSAALALGRWELGVAAALDVQYIDLKRHRAPSSAIGVGVMVGRRESIGSHSVLGGGRLMVAALNDESERDTGERGAAEVRVGASIGVALAATSSWRLRADLGADLVPHNIGGSFDAKGHAIVPWWAVSTLLGVEFGGT